MAILYICIDESGNHSHDDCYTVAGCWCISEQRNQQTVLAPSKDKLLTQLKEMKQLRRQPSELKGTSIHPNQIESLLDSFQSINIMIDQ